MKDSSNCQTWVNWNWQECYVKNSQRSFAFEIGFLCVAAPMSPKNVTQDVTLKLLTRSDFFCIFATVLQSGVSLSCSV